MSRILFFSLFFALTFLFANEESLPIEESPKEPVAKLIYLKQQLPNDHTYVNEIIEVTFEALILDENISNKSTEFFDEQNVVILNENSTWEELGDNNYRNKIYIKINAENSTIPGLRLKVSFENGISQEEIFSPKEIKAIKLRHSNDSSNVIAKDLKILNEKITTYDKTNNILVMELEGENANLSDFFIRNMQRQGIEILSQELPYAKAIYYAIIPKQMLMFKFEYFNTIQNKYIPISIPNEAVDDTVSTQSDIQPKQTFEISKIATVSLVFLILLYFLIRHRQYLLLIFMMPLVVYLVGLLQPQEEIVIKSGARMSILPTENSTVFHIVEDEISSKILLNRGDFYKIELKEGKIGWVKKDDVRKN